MLPPYPADTGKNGDRANDLSNESTEEVETFSVVVLAL
jgi:hypothetical protein